jgi:hypothetical protein
MLLLATVAAAVAGPWVHPAGEGYAKAGYTWFSSAEGFVDGESTGLRYASHALDAYGELGLGGGWQLVGGLPLIFAANVGSDGTRYTHNWTGDLRLELDRRISRGAPLAVGLEARIPTYREPTDYSRVRGVDDVYLEAIEDQFPQLGDRNLDLTAKLLAGVSLGAAWVSAEAGPRWRSGGFAPGVYGAVNTGAWLFDRRGGLSLFASGNLNLPVEAERASRQLLQLRGTAFAALPGGLTLEAWGGGVVLAQYASTGIDLGLGVSGRFRDLYGHKEEG